MAIWPITDRIAGWRRLGIAAARLDGVGDYDVPFGVVVDRAAAEPAARTAGTPFEGGVRSLRGRVENVIDLDEEGLIHGEINEANAGRQANGEVALLDCDGAGVGPLALGTATR